MKTFVIYHFPIIFCPLNFPLSFSPVKPPFFGQFKDLAKSLILFYFDGLDK